MAAGDIHDGAKAGEVISRGYRANGHLREIRHGQVEYLIQFGLTLEPVEGLHAVQLGNDGPTGADRIDAVAPILVVLRRAHEPGESRHRIRRLPPKGGRERCQVVAAVAASAEDATADQRPQQPAQRAGVGTNPIGQLVAPQGPVGKRIGDAEIGSDGDGLGQPGANDELCHRYLRGRQRLVKPQEMMTHPIHGFNQPDRRS